MYTKQQFLSLKVLQGVWGSVKIKQLLREIRKNESRYEKSGGKHSRENKISTVKQFKRALRDTNTNSNIK